jgi:NCAIR mutase (PurE)-related protein
MYARIRELLPGVKYQARARCLMAKSEDGALQRLPGTVGLAGAGGADAAALDMTRLLLQHLGAFVIVKDDLSAGSAQALAAAAPALQVCDVVIVVAGADAALPTAVASFVDAPVLAVPTAAWAPPAGAAPVAVTAADDGASAAVMAARMLRTAAARAVQIAEAAAAAAAHQQMAAQHQAVAN